MLLKESIFGRELDHYDYLEIEVESHKPFSFYKYYDDNDFISIVDVKSIPLAIQYQNIFYLCLDEKDCTRTIENRCSTVELMNANFEAFCEFMLFKKQHKFLIYLDDYESNVYKYFLKRLKERFTNGGGMIRVIKYVYKTTLPLNIRILYADGKDAREIWNRIASMDLLEMLVENGTTPTWKPRAKYEKDELYRFLSFYNSRSGIYTLFRWVETFIDMKKKTVPKLLTISPELLEYILIEYPDVCCFEYCTYFRGAIKMIHYYRPDNRELFECYLLNDCVTQFLHYYSSHYHKWFWIEVKEFVTTKNMVTVYSDLQKYVYIINAGLSPRPFVLAWLENNSPTLNLILNRYTLRYFRTNREALTLFCCLKRCGLYFLRFYISGYYKFKLKCEGIKTTKKKTSIFTQINY